MASTLGEWRIDSTGVQPKAVDRMRELIIKGELAPGARVSEAALAEAFGLSRTPVREAIKQLQVEGLVNIVPRVGTFVSAPSRREIVELFQVKEALEGLGARLMAYRGRSAELEQLERNVRESEEAVGEEELERYVELIDEFHNLIISGADNGKLSDHYRTLMNQLAYGRLVFTSLNRPGRPAKSVAEHRAVLEAIDAKDAEGAELAMREHVRHSERELVAGLAEAQESGERTTEAESQKEE